MSAVKYLKKKEWSMGNGQCPECCGVPESWHGHPCHMEASSIGHEKNCSLAQALRDLGESPLMMGDFKGPDLQGELEKVEGSAALRWKTSEVAT